MARRYEFFQESTGRDWICFDMKLGRKTAVPATTYHSLSPSARPDSRNDISTRGLGRARWASAATTRVSLVPSVLTRQ